MSDKKPYWWPTKTDDAWLTKIRSDYPQHASMSDDQIRSMYANGRKYDCNWDHTGDAYSDYEKVADRMLALEEATANIASVMLLAEIWAEQQELPESDICTAALKDIRRHLKTIDKK